MTSIGIAVSALLSAAFAYWWRSRRRGTGISRAKEPAGRHFASVEIRAGSGACDAAKTLAGERFLAHQAPPLPLRACTEARCRCSFAKLSDRREDSRRWADDGLGASVFNAAERRERPDRRDSD